MPCTHVPSADAFRKTLDLGIGLEVYPVIDGVCEVAVVETQNGHNQEFYDVKSTFTYLVIDGNGSFFIEDKEVPVAQGDMISIRPNTRFYHKGALKLVLITTPPWDADNEVETRSRIW